MRFTARMVVWKVAQEAYILTATVLLNGAAILDRRADARGSRSRAVRASIHTPFGLAAAWWSSRGEA